MDGMLDRIEPRQLDEWIAYFRLEPDELCRIREVLVQGLTALCIANGMKIEPEHIDPARAEDKKPQYVSPKLAANLFAGALGL